MKWTPRKENKHSECQSTRKTHTEEIKQESESGSDTAEILDLSQQEFKITMNNMLRSLTGKVYNMAKKMETLTKNKKEIQN